MDFSRSKEFILPAIILKLLQHPIIHRLVLSRIDTSHAYWCTIAVRFQHLSNIWATFRPHRLGSLWQGRTSKILFIASPACKIYRNLRKPARRRRARAMHWFSAGHRYSTAIRFFKFVWCFRQQVFHSFPFIHQFLVRNGSIWRALRAGPIGLYFWPDNVTLRKTCCPRDITFRPKKSTLFKPGSANFL